MNRQILHKLSVFPGKKPQNQSDNIQILIPEAVTRGNIQKPLKTPRPMRSMQTIEAGQTRPVPIMAVVRRIEKVPNDKEPTRPQEVRHIPIKRTRI